MGMCNFYKTAIFIQSIQDENIDIDITVSEIFCVMTCELIQRLATHNMTFKAYSDVLILHKRLIGRHLSNYHQDTSLHVSLVDLAS